MQRFNLIETTGLAGKTMADANDGRWVKYEHVKHLVEVAQQLGYKDIEDALSDLGAIKELMSM